MGAFAHSDCALYQLFSLTDSLRRKGARETVLIFNWSHAEKEPPLLVIGNRSMYSEVNEGRRKKANSAQCLGRLDSVAVWGEQWARKELMRMRIALARAEMWLLLLFFACPLNQLHTWDTLVCNPLSLVFSNSGMHNLRLQAIFSCPLPCSSLFFSLSGGLCWQTCNTTKCVPPVVEPIDVSVCTFCPFYIGKNIQNCAYIYSWQAHFHLCSPSALQSALNCLSLRELKSGC